MSRRHPLCCWVASSLRSPQTRQLCPAGSMQLTFCYFSSIWVFFCCFFLNGCGLSAKVMHQSPSQPYLSLKPVSSRWSSAGAASPAAVHRMEKDADTLLQQELWPSLCCLLQPVSVRSITAAVGDTDEDESYKFPSPDLLPIPMPLPRGEGDFAVSANKFHPELLDQGLSVNKASSLCIH